jgi:hypothetical protein
VAASSLKPRPRLAAAPSLTRPNPTFGFVGGPTLAAPGPLSTPGVSPNNPLSGDMIFQNKIGLNKVARSDAGSSYLDSLKQRLFGFGSEKLARAAFEKILPSLRQSLGQDINLDPWYGAFAGQDNPDTGYSQIAQFEHAKRNALNNLNEDYNQQNLWFSGARAKGLNEFDYAKQAEYGQLEGALQDQLSQLGQQYLASLRGADTADVQAAAEARDRAVADLAAGGITPSGPSAAPQASPQTIGAGPYLPLAGLPAALAPKKKPVAPVKFPLLRAR